MYFYTWILAIFIALTSPSVFAKWDEERDMTINGREELVYYSKTNAQGQKLVLDKYLKRLIFVQNDRLYKRTINQIKVDGVVIEVTSDPFSHYPEQTAIIFDNKDEVLKKLFLAKEVEVSVRYGREPGLCIFKIK
jgi:hypothetical protein